MINVSGYGLKGRVVASNTFPSGFKVEGFADDADPLDSPDFTAADTASALNGDLVVWSRAAGIEVAFNVIPTSEDDVNLSALLEANRVGKNKKGARDVIKITTTYPSGAVVNYSNGVIISGSLIPAVGSNGRIKTRQYRFRFEQVNKSGETGQEI
ncbi:phage tail fiber protein [Citrobacter sp.]|uniref:phage tail fiber protein n=1 Tax=Citrobacter sp. TaxID=1896336 RepID=UPI002FCA1E84